MRIHVKDQIGRDSARAVNVQMEIPEVMDIVKAAQAGDNAFLENMVFLVGQQLIQHQFSAAAAALNKEGNLAPRVGKPGQTQVWRDGDVWKYNWSRKPSESSEFTQADRDLAEMMVEEFPELDYQRALEKAKARRLARREAAKNAPKAFGVNESPSGDDQETGE